DYYCYSTDISGDGFF
nr:immunoglobulin light chain junction region [Macaca mulatta]MOX17668.1 immunoglobulin light chain junction region [Macaca mulatta]MOX17816.1 immunoglobulin light chain junction region [Macaca mulatta]MOX17948.1 immunoglobulin light chain junction region [Macaca mulatta]MOX17974.1 immunoglobulin light chain junction region [Macaca mulatta]